MLYAQQIGLPLKRAQKGYGGPLRAAGSRLTSPRVHFQVGVLPELLDSDQHLSRHQILAFFCAAIGSLRPLVPIAPWKLDSFRLGDNRTFDLSTGI
jgi:hypothetical protein